ncbi:MAG: alpha-mannosidase [Clostridia bacterium]|nr:alpha-mannosidase [Clostridia bacterium]
MIEKAVDLLRARYEQDGAITFAAAEEAEAVLMPLSEEAKSYHVHCVAHAHIDMNWMWGYAETSNIVVDTVRTMLQLMREYPTFTFSQSQAAVYEILEKYAPDLLDEVRVRLKEGRWEVTAATWVEADKNLPGSESFARQFLYAKRYLKELLGLTSDDLSLDFEPDTFGHAATVPASAVDAGVRYYYYNRGMTTPEFAHRWRSPGGAELIAWRDPHSYGSIIEYNLFSMVPRHCQMYGAKDYLAVYGVSDHGGGPTRRDLNRLREMASWPIMPHIFFSTYKRFFSVLEAYRDSLPVVEGEMNYIFTGCYTSQTRLKAANKLSETRLYESEWLSAAAHRMTGKARRNKMYEEAWRNTLFNQFHDILPGSCTAESRDFAMGGFQKSMAAANVESGNSMRAIADAIDLSGCPYYVDELDPADWSGGAGVGFASGISGGYGAPQVGFDGSRTRAFHVFNPTSADYDGVVSVTVWDWKGASSRARFTDSKGNELSASLLKDDTLYWRHRYKIFAVKMHLPAFGYATCILSERESGLPPYAHNWSTRAHVFAEGDIILENSLVKAVFDRTTLELLSFTDKRTGKVSVNKPAAFFELIMEDGRRGMSSWQVGSFQSRENLNQSGKVALIAAQTGGLRQQILYSIAFDQGSQIAVTVILDDNSDTLVYEVKAQLNLRGSSAGIPRLNFTLPLSFAASGYRYDLPFGVIDRPALNHDVPANSFAAALPDEGAESIMLSADCKHGFRCCNNKLSLALMRASFEPDSQPENVEHHFRLAITALPDTDACRLYHCVEHFIYRPLVCAASPSDRRSGKLSPEGQLFELDGKLIVSSVKCPEDSDGLLIRLFNPDKEAALCTLRFTDPVKTAALTDTMEEKFEPIPFTGNQISMSVEPHGIITLKIGF